MTASDLELLEAQLDGTVEITLASGESLLIRPIIVVDELPTPDLFYLPLGADGSPTTMAGASILLEEIISVRLPG